MSTSPEGKPPRSRRRVAPDPIREDGVGRDVLQARCQVLELAVSKQPGITPELVAANRPGGADNKDQSGTGWLTYLCWLHGQYARGPQTPKGNAARWDARAMDDMRAAMAAEPIYLTMENGRQIGVYPKGEAALNRLVVNQMALQWATIRRVALHDLADEHTTTTLDTLRDVTRFEAFLQAEFITIVTHPGAYLPWDDVGTWEHPLPRWTLEASPFDLLAIRAAYYDVNLFRINAIAERSRHFASSGDPMPLAAFLGVMADELKVKPEELARRYSLGEVFAMSYAKYEATERAKARAAADAPPKT